MAGKSLKPGQKASRSGQYKSTGTGKEITSTKGKVLPLGPKGTKYKLIDPTKHKGKK